MRLLGRWLRLPKSHSPVIRMYLAVIILLTVAVMSFGAYTRLTDSGLGCPDWPGCYGQFLAPSSLEASELTKAWIEMIHRYLASSLGLLVVVWWLVNCWWRQLGEDNFLYLASLTLLMIIGQGLLGKYTVTMRLYPVIVMSHLLGGFVVLTLLWLQLQKLFLMTEISSLTLTFAIANDGGDQILNSCKLTRYWLYGFIIILFGQILLGGWTSANYAGLVCPDFPTCQGKWLPQFDAQALKFWAAGIFDSPGLVLGNAARVTVQMLHRLGALALVLVWLGLLLRLMILSRGKLFLSKANIISLWAISGVLLLQIALGIGNIHSGLNLWVAWGHNLVAIILWLLTIRLVVYFHKN